ncbi:MAG: hypothetical protein II150_02910, partial [Thermoguttaceae bacterium]|nr:hypothetical protein [Thermoguttaceae bacterium]
FIRLSFPVAFHRGRPDTVFAECHLYRVVAHHDEARSTANIRRLAAVYFLTAQLKSSIAEKRNRTPLKKLSVKYTNISFCCCGAVLER